MSLSYAETAKEIEEQRKTFLRKWRLKCRAVADSLEEAGEKLFTFTRLPPDRRHVVLGAARVRANHHVQGRRLADAGHQTNRRGH
jgi:transposase-like protein